MKKILLIIIFCCSFFVCCEKKEMIDTDYYVKIVNGYVEEGLGKMKEFYDDAINKKTSSITIDMFSNDVLNRSIIKYTNNSFLLIDNTNEYKFMYLNHSYRNYNIEGYKYVSGEDYCLTNDETEMPDKIFNKKQVKGASYQIELDGAIIYSTYKQVNFII